MSAHVSVLNAAARGLIESGKPAHLVTVNPDGSPQVTLVWVGLDGDELVSGHLDDRQKLRNVRRDPGWSCPSKAASSTISAWPNISSWRGQGTSQRAAPPSCCSDSRMPISAGRDLSTW
jgi:Pyridoxamine 5'-phosphate oxidase